MTEELIEVIDNNSNILRIVSRKNIINNNLKHKAALIIVINSKNQIYVNQRKKTKKVFPLKWAVGAGGAVRTGEEYKEAAHRELKEELCFDSKLNFLFNFDYESEIVNYKAKVYLTNYDGVIKLNKNEFEQGTWIDMDKLKEMIRKKLLCPDTEICIKKYFKENLKFDFHKIMRTT
ncbi:MAG: NUDIX domain-containing protein [Nanoarchaeota archaeon]|nr:NUDIX domain-containing protein [Nanoarchaeota archaeon]